MRLLAYNDGDHMQHKLASADCDCRFCLSLPLHCFYHPPVQGASRVYIVYIASGQKEREKRILQENTHARVLMRVLYPIRNIHYQVP